MEIMILIKNLGSAGFVLTGIYTQMTETKTRPNKSKLIFGLICSLIAGLSSGAEAACDRTYDFLLSRRSVLISGTPLKLSRKASKNENKTLKLNVPIELFCDTVVVTESSSGLINRKIYKLSTRTRVRVNNVVENRREQFDYNRNLDFDFTSLRIDYVDEPIQGNIRVEIASLNTLKARFGTSREIFEIPLTIRSETTRIDFLLRIENPNPERLIVPF